MGFTGSCGVLLGVCSPLQVLCYLGGGALEFKDGAGDFSAGVQRGWQILYYARPHSLQAFGERKGFRKTLRMGGEELKPSTTGCERKTCLECLSGKLHARLQALQALPKALHITLKSLSISFWACWETLPGHIKRCQFQYQGRMEGYQG